MSKVKLRFIILLAFVLLAAIVTGIVLGVPYGGGASAIDYSPTTIFSQGTGGDVVTSAADAGGDSYVKFSFSDDGNVYFRRDLALKWFVSSKPAEDAPAGTAESGFADAGECRYFTMKFAFAPADVSKALVESVERDACPRCGTALEAGSTVCGHCNFSITNVVLFDRYEIKFDSTEENISKDAKATNSIVFKAQEDGGVNVYVKDAARHAAEDKDDDAEKDDLEGLTPVKIAAADIASDLTLALGEKTDGAPGEFTVYLTVGEGAAQEIGTFTNIGANFLEYRSSASSTPSTPITFNAKLAALPQVPEGENWNRVRQQILMKELNGQSFKVNDGRVVDDAPAVLVLNEEVYSFTLGQRYNLTTEAIDVCDDSVTVDRSYYMLRTEEDDEDAYHIPTDEDYKDLTTSTYFMPTREGGARKAQYISIRYMLRDGRYSEADKSNYGYVYLSWYANLGFVETFSDATGENKLDMILVENGDGRADPVGPYYVGLTADDSNPDKPKNTGDDLFAEAVGKYIEKLTDVAKDEKTSAGNGAYIYLPSFRGLISSNYADYRNLRFTISYKKENSSTSASTESSLRYNNLRFQIDMEGHYAFKVFASDAAGNAMKYYLDKELVDVTSSNVWDIDEIPTFEFDISYKGAEVTEPGELDPASRGTSYSLEDFDIVDLGSNIKEYTLFYFDTGKLPQDKQSPAYSEFVENAKQYAEEDYKDCLIEIGKFNSKISEDDEEWADTDNDYHWDPDSSLSFVPQKSGYYVVRLTYYDLYQTVGGAPAAKNYYEVVEVRNPYDYIPAKSDWLENNVTSVVLFSISGVLAIIIVVLFVVKPSEKKVEEVDLATLKGKKEKKNKKK